MNTKSTAHDQYKSDFNYFRSGHSSPKWLDQLHLEGFKSFQESGFPVAAKNNENWRFTNVKPLSDIRFKYNSEHTTAQLDTTEIKSLFPWDERWHTMVFMDGIYNSTLSTTNIIEGKLESLSNTISANDDSITEHLGKYLPLKHDGFTAINTAFLNEGAVIKIPDNQNTETPVHLLFISTGSITDSVSHPRSLVILGENSSLNLIESYVSISDKQYFTNSLAEVILSKGAQLEHYRYMSESSRAFHIGNTQVQLESNAQFKTTSISKGAQLARNALHVSLNGINSSCSITGLYLTEKTQHIDNHINVEHMVPQCSSYQQFKGVLDDRSKAVFSGRVVVHKDAQKTIAHQSDKNLILSQGARINTKPSLEIFADDVECTHGATAGSVAEDALFYMRSRGIDEKTAKQILISGFAAEIVETIPIDSLKTYLTEMISKTLSGPVIAA